MPETYLDEMKVYMYAWHIFVVTVLILIQEVLNAIQLHQDLIGVLTFESNNASDELFWTRNFFIRQLGEQVWFKYLRNKTEKNWCTVTVALVIEHECGHSWNPANHIWSPGAAKRARYYIVIWSVDGSRCFRKLLGNRCHMSFHFYFYSNNDPHSIFYPEIISWN